VNEWRLAHRLQAGPVWTPGLLFRLGAGVKRAGLPESTSACRAPLGNLHNELETPHEPEAFARAAASYMMPVFLHEVIEVITDPQVDGWCLEQGLDVLMKRDWLRRTKGQSGVARPRGRILRRSGVGFIAQRLRQTEIQQLRFAIRRDLDVGRATLGTGTISPAYRYNFLRFFADGAAKKWPLRGS
jgi:hypothetical protein